MKQQISAAIDLGTNSCRLLIADGSGRTLYRNAVSTRLGEGMCVGEICRFTDEAMKRGIECFCHFKKVMDEYGVDKYRAITTAACRMADNAAVFVEEIKRQSGIELEIIDPYEEAVLNLKGALVNVANETAGYVVIYDLGGGSTEITLATRSAQPKILHSISIPWGARNAAEKFGLKEYDPAVAALLDEKISAYVKSFVRDSGLEKYDGDVCFIAASSTPLRLTHIARGWKKYDRQRADGQKVGVEEFERAVAKVCAMDCAQMAQDDNIGPLRADIFHAACVIFSRIYKDLGAKEMITSLKVAVDGIIMELSYD